MSSGQGFGLIFFFHSSRLHSVNRLDSLTHLESSGDIIKLVCILFNCTSYHYCISSSALKMHSSEMRNIKKPKQIVLHHPVYWITAQRAAQLQAFVWSWWDGKQTEQGWTLLLTDMKDSYVQYSCVVCIPTHFFVYHICVEIHVSEILNAHTMYKFCSVFSLFLCLSNSGTSLLMPVKSQ